MQTLKKLSSLPLASLIGYQWEHAGCFFAISENTAGVCLYAQPRNGRGEYPILNADGVAVFDFPEGYSPKLRAYVTRALEALSPVRYRTNGQLRPILLWDDLSPKEQAEFAYLDTPEAQDGAMFARYHGHVYDIGEFMALGDESTLPAYRGRKWQGIAHETAFSGTVCRVTTDRERVLMASYYAR